MGSIGSTRRFQFGLTFHSDGGPWSSCSVSVGCCSFLTGDIRRNTKIVASKVIVPPPYHGSNRLLPSVHGIGRNRQPRN